MPSNRPQRRAPAALLVLAVALLSLGVDARPAFAAPGAGAATASSAIVTPGNAFGTATSSGSRLGSPEIFGYLTYWNLAAQIDYGAMTTVAYFGLTAGANGKLVRRDSNGTLTTEYSRWQSTTVNNAIASAHAHHDRFVLTVERMAWDDAGKAATRALLSSPTARTTLVKDIVGEVQARGIDGVSLDFEPLLGDQRDNFAAFVVELRKALSVANPAYQITFATTGSQTAAALSMINQLTSSGAADAVIIMAYPLRGLDAQYAGGLAPMRSATSYDLVEIANSYLTAVAANKIVMALPWYGREWPTVTADLNSRVQTDQALYGRAHNIDYADALTYARQYGRSLDATEMTAWTALRGRSCSSCPETWVQVYYDDIDTLGYKFDWVASKGMAGIGIFALGYDGQQPEFWKLLRVKYRGLVDTTPPTGSVSFAAGENLCSPSSVKLSLSAADTGGSGVAFARLSTSLDTDARGTLVRGRTYPTTGTVTWSTSDPATGGSAATGAHAVYAQWRDVAGNWSAPVALNYAYDPASASVLVAGGAKFASSATVSVVVSQTGGRAIARVLVASSSALTGRVLSTGDDATLGSPPLVALADPALDGPNFVYAQWQDSAGCWSRPVAAPIALDRTPPSGKLSILDNAALSTDGTARIVAPATDALSGVASVELSNDGITWQPFQSTSDPISWSAGGPGDGPWTIRGRWTDVAGNVSAAGVVSLLLDRHGPEGTVTINQGAPWTASASVNLDVSATDAVSAVAAVRVANDPMLNDTGVLAGGSTFAPGSPIAWTLPAGEGAHTVYVQWQDSAGNWSDARSATIGVDTSAPSLAPSHLGLTAKTQLNAGQATVSATSVATDAGSGVATSAIAI